MTDPIVKVWEGRTAVIAYADVQTVQRTPELGGVVVTNHPHDNHIRIVPGEIERFILEWKAYREALESPALCTVQVGEAIVTARTAEELAQMLAMLNKVDER